MRVQVDRRRHSDDLHNTEAIYQSFKKKEETMIAARTGADN